MIFCKATALSVVSSFLTPRASSAAIQPVILSRFPTSIFAACHTPSFSYTGQEQPPLPPQLLKSMVSTRSGQKRSPTAGVHRKRKNDTPSTPTKPDDDKPRKKTPKVENSLVAVTPITPEDSAPTTRRDARLDADNQESSNGSSSSSSDNDKKDTNNNNNNNNNVLLSLSPDCVEATLICRPSQRNKSPYVADVYVPSLQRPAICHVPNLDMGGKCRAGATLWIKPQRDPKTGQRLGPHAVNPKYGTPKCEFVAQLLRVDERRFGPLYGPPVWVGAHPSLGEHIAERWIQQHVEQGGNVLTGVGPMASYQKQVKINAHSRADFVLRPTAGGRPRIVEVKTVVDTDYNHAWGLPEIETSGSSSPKKKKMKPTDNHETPAAQQQQNHKLKCVFQVPPGSKHDKYGIFPWGQSKQKGPHGEAVVSARAIKHVRELTQMVRSKVPRGKRDDDDEVQQHYDATILFVVVRHDAQAFRPNHEACPSFAKYLKEAQDAGVQVLAKRVQWGEGEQMGQCLDSGALDVVFPPET